MVAHLIALAILSANPAQWEVPKLKQPGYYRKERLVPPLTLSPETMGFEHIEEVIHALGTKTWQPRQVAAKEPAVIWQRQRVDILLQGDRPKPISLYVHAEAHTFFYNIFGNAIFQRLEFVLDYLLNDQRNWLDIEAEGAFLEHGSELFELEGSRWEADTVFVGDNPEVPSAPSQNDPLAALNVPSWMLDAEHAEPFLQEKSLRLAQHLGLLTSATTDLQAVRAATTDAFVQRYHLEHVKPSDGTAYHILKQRGIPAERPQYLNAVDYHLFEIFRLYVRAMIPKRGPDRASLPVLATLAQPWLYLTRNTLEAFSGHRVRKTQSDSWSFIKARSEEYSLSNANAYRVARCLLEVAPFYQDGSKAQLYADLEDRERLSLPSGLALIERALAKVNQASDDKLNSLAVLGQTLRRELIAEALTEKKGAARAKRPGRS